jgi:hypothetical protein
LELLDKGKGELIGRHDPDDTKDWMDCVNRSDIMKYKEVLFPAKRLGCVLFPDNLDNFGVYSGCSMNCDHEVRSMNMTLILKKKGEPV